MPSDASDPVERAYELMDPFCHTRSDFVVVSQFRVDIPGTQGRKCIVPDEVLFVNGIPLALVECKKPGSALSEAVRQHLRYADRPRAAG